MARIGIGKILGRQSVQISGYVWLVKGFLYSAVYYVIASVLYDVVAEIRMRKPTHLFTPLDYRIPFVSAFAIFYVFVFYPFLIFTLGYFFFYRAEKADRVMASLLIIYAISYVTYIIFPVEMKRPLPSELPSDFLSRVMARYYEEDPPLNCFPSLHAANSTISAYWLSREKKEYAPVFWTVAFLIMLSTLFVRQHVIVDEIAGFLVAYFAGFIAERKVPVGEPIQEKRVLRLAVFIGLATAISFMQVATYIP